MASESRLAPLRRFFMMLQPDRKDLGLIYVFAVFNGLVNLSLPLGVQAIIQLINGATVSSSWWILIAVVLVGTALTGVLQILQLSVLESIQQRLFSRAAIEFAYRTPRFKAEALRNFEPTDLMNRFFDVLTVQKGLPKILLDFATSGLNIVFGLVLLSFYHPFFVFFGLVALLLLALVFYLYGNRGLKTSYAESSYKYKTAFWLEEVARSLITFKMAGRTELATQRSDKLAQSYIQARKDHFKVLLGQYAYTVGFKVIITAGLLIIGGLLVMQRELNIGQFVAGEIIIILIINATEKIIFSLETVYDTMTGLEKIGQVSDIELEHRNDKASFALPIDQGVECRMSNIRFSPEGKAVLDQIDLTIGASERCCLIGKEGSGKTALLHVLGSLFYDFEGVLAYNGMPIGSLDIEQLRFVIGENFNQENLFSGSLLENITLGREGIEQTELMNALKVAGLSEFVQSLPEGLNTEFEPSTKHLPNSIVTRIILARSMVHRPSLLLLDNLHEFESLDNYQGLVQCIVDRNRAWTLVVASNDAHIARLCDRVVWLEGGRIKAQGTLDEILQIPGAGDVLTSNS